MEIKINKEICQYHETLFFGLSARQFICSVFAIAIAVGIYFLTKNQHLSHNRPVCQKSS